MPNKRKNALADGLATLTLDAPSPEDTASQVRRAKPSDKAERSSPAVPTLADVVPTREPAAKPAAAVRPPRTKKPPGPTRGSRARTIPFPTSAPQSPPPSPSPAPSDCPRPRTDGQPQRPPLADATKAPEPMPQPPAAPAEAGRDGPASPGPTGWVRKLLNGLALDPKACDDPRVAARVRVEVESFQPLYADDFLKAIGHADTISILGARGFLDEARLQAGNPTDLVERVMVESLMITRFRLPQIHAAAERAKNDGTAKVYLSAAMGLTREMTNTALALVTIRESNRRGGSSRTESANDRSGGMDDAAKPQAAGGGTGQSDAPGSAHGRRPTEAA
jgi:hypothetical protein